MKPRLESQPWLSGRLTQLVEYLIPVQKVERSNRSVVIFFPRLRMSTTWSTRFWTPLPLQPWDLFICHGSPRLDNNSKRNQGFEVYQTRHYDTDRNLAEYMQHQLPTIWHSVETDTLRMKWWWYIGIQSLKRRLESTARWDITETTVQYSLLESLLGMHIFIPCTWLAWQFAIKDNG